MLKKVEYTVYPITDTARSRAFYETTLGLAVGKHADHGVWTEYDLPGGGGFALFKTDTMRPSSDAGGRDQRIERIDLERDRELKSKG